MRYATTAVSRRRLIGGTAALGGLGLAGCAAGPAAPHLARVRAEQDRIFDITVCLRPFRAAGPRLDCERIGDALVVHNYGHGGSGWSLSWGSGDIAVRNAMAGSPAEIAVIGCGALGLTSAILAQRAGARVTIYASELMPQTRSARATGTWSPDSRIALTRAAAPGFAAAWEGMARSSFRQYRTYLGLPGSPVVWNDRYTITDLDLYDPKFPRAPDPLGFAHYEDAIRDLTSGVERLPAGSAPFDAPFVYRSEAMMFNIASYGHLLMSDFLAAGGQFRRRVFNHPGELAALPQKVVINCTGYGARALWRDNSIKPVRGQIAWLIPQPEVNYGVSYNNVSVLSRSDGIVVQAVEGGEMKGYGDGNESPDRGEAERAVSVIAGLYGRMGRV